MKSPKKNADAVMIDGKRRRAATMGKKVTALTKRIRDLESTIGRLDGKKVRKKRKGRAKKEYTRDSLPTVAGFGGQKLVRDGIYGDFSVYFGRIYNKAVMTEEEGLAYYRALRSSMIEAFGTFHRTWDECIKTIEVDNSHLRKHKSKGS
jgi:hypothetical protein